MKLYILAKRNNLSGYEYVELGTNTTLTIFKNMLENILMEPILYLLAMYFIVFPLRFEFKKSFNLVIE